MTKSSSRALKRLLRKGATCVSALLLSVSTLPAVAGEFAVSPIRLDLDQSSKSGSITVTNDADRELKVQLHLYHWFQGPTGKDDYVDSEDLLYFPRLTTIAPHAQKVVRIGVRAAPAGAQEKSYRLFVEELPERRPSIGGVRLAIAIRFGVPIFLKPAVGKASGTIERLVLEKGQLRVVVRNTGNVHFKIASVNASSGELFSAQSRGWYLLPGSAREYAIPIPVETCRRLNHVDLVVKTDKMRLEGAVKTKREMCGG